MILGAIGGYKGGYEQLCTDLEIRIWDLSRLEERFLVDFVVRTTVDEFGESVRNWGKIGVFIGMYAYVYVNIDGWLDTFCAKKLS